MRPNITKKSRNLIKNPFFILSSLLVALFALAIFYWLTFEITPINNVAPLVSFTNNKNGYNNKPLISPPQQTTPSPSNNQPKSEDLVSGECNEIFLGNKTEAKIALTFDAGAGTGSIEKILEILKENNIKASFFLTGKWAQKNSNWVKKISESSHEIYNHTYSHSDLTKLSDEEIKNQLARADEIVENLTGKSTKPFFRPPYGKSDKHILDIACQMGWQSVKWTVDALDWKPETTAEQAKQRIYSKQQNGAIVLMHIGDNLSAEILPEVINKLKSDGYELVALSELLS